MKVAIFLFALLAVAFSDLCITLPASLSKDQNCAIGGTPCKQGLYCGVNGKCTPVLAVGQTCVSTYQDGNSVNMCERGSACKGPLGSKVCVANASPSEACSSDPLVTIPYCGAGLSCASNGLCTGGKIGDKCFNSTDCDGGANCTNSRCAFSPIGAFCTSDTLCPLDTFCQSNACTPLLTLGVQCPPSSPRSCANGAVCVGQSSLDTPVCVANQTREPGQYCGNQDSLCKGSMKCKNSYCAKQAPEQCQMQSFADTNTECIKDNFCLCGSDLGYGSGRCVKDSCLEKKKALQDCATPVCGSDYSVSNMISYSGSCINLNCKDLAAAYLLCSPASSFGASFSLIFFSLLISFFSKKF